MTQPYKALHVVDSLDLGGAQTFLYHALRQRADPAASFEIAALHGPGQFSEQFEKAGIAVHHLAKSKFDPLLIWRLGRLIRRGGYDIVHAHLVISSFLCEQFRRRWKIPKLAIHVHAMLDRDFGERYQKPLQKRIGIKADMIIGCSQAALGTLPSPRPKRVLHNGVETKSFAPAAEAGKVAAAARTTLRTRYGFAPQHRVIGYTGRLSQEKNLPMLLEAFAAEAAARPDWRLLVVGSGSLEEALKDRARDLGLADKVVFAGFNPDSAGHMRAMDVFVFPSDHEGFGIALVEAMSCGLPCIASAYDAVGEIMAHEREGLIFPCGNAVALGAALRRMEDEPGLAESLGAAARARAVAQFDYAIIGARLAEIYAELLAMEPAAS